MYKIYFTKKAEKELDKLASSDIKSILNKIIKLTIPFPENLDIKKLSGVLGFYRLRIGKVRIIFEILDNKEEIWIRKVGYRQSIYKN